MQVSSSSPTTGSDNHYLVLPPSQEEPDAVGKKILSVGRSRSPEHASSAHKIYEFWTDSRETLRTSKELTDLRTHVQNRNAIHEYSVKQLPELSPFYELIESIKRFMFHFFGSETERELFEFLRSSTTPTSISADDILSQFERQESNFLRSIEQYRTFKASTSSLLDQEKFKTYLSENSVNGELQQTVTKAATDYVNLCKEKKLLRKIIKTKPLEFTGNIPQWASQVMKNKHDDSFNSYLQQLKEVQGKLSKAARHVLEPSRAEGIPKNLLSEIEKCRTDLNAQPPKP